MKLSVELPDLGVTARADLYGDRAPSVCRAIFDALETPLETKTSHACFSGHQIYCFLPPFGAAPPVENSTLRSDPGDVMFWYAAENAYAWMHDEAGRMAPEGASAAVHELAFNYGVVDLSYFASEGWHGSLVGRIADGLDEFAAACAETLSNGSTRLRVSRAAS